MVSVSKPMKASQATNYFDKDDYYLRSGGTWHGQGAERLGLSGGVNKDDFLCVASGCDPRSGKAVIEAKSEKNGLDHRAGIDITFSPPKSVSLAALSNDIHKELHGKAVSSVLDYIEREMVTARQTTDGVTVAVRTGNMVVARFDHLTSRELDPQLHTHCFLANMTQREDEQWRATHNDAIYREQRFIGRMYDNELQRLYKEAGYQTVITDREKGTWELAGVTKELIKEFSERAEQVQTRFKELKEMGAYPGANDTELRKIATLETRKAKPEHIDKEYLKTKWENGFAKHGQSIEGLGMDLEANRKEQPAPALSTADYLERAAEVIHSQESAFAKADLLHTALKMSQGEHSVEAFEKAFHSSPDFVSLGEKRLDRTGNTVEMWTTEAMIATEQSVVAAVKRGKGGFAAVATREEVEAFLSRQEAQKTEALRAEGKREGEGYQFTKGQREYIVSAITGNDSVLIAQGDPGVGKTTSREMIRLFNEELAGQGRQQHYTVGVAFTGKASGEIAAKGVTASTIDSFLSRQIEAVAARTGKPEQAEGKIVVPKGAAIEILVDEASMVSSQHLASIMHRAEEWRQQLNVPVKITLSGDTKQMVAIGAGRLFADIQEKTDTERVHLTDITRQKAGTYTHEVAMAMNGGKDTDRALRILKDNGRVVEDSDRQKLVGAAVNAYLDFARKGETGFVVTALNADRQELNSRVRAELVKEGRVAEGESYNVLVPAGNSGSRLVAADNFRPGQVITYAGGEGAGIRAGSRGEVTAVDPTANTVTVRYGKDVEVAHNLRDDWQKLSVHDRQERRFGVGDEVVFLKNDRKLGVTNGDRGKVTGIEDGRLTVFLPGSGHKVSFKVAEASRGKGGLSYAFLDHGYAITTEKSQGTTVQNSVVFAYVKPDGLSPDRKALSKVLDGEPVGRMAHDRAMTTMSAAEANWQSKTAIAGHEATLSVRLADLGDKTVKVVRFDFADPNAVVKDAEARKEMKNAGAWFNSTGKAWITAIDNERAFSLIGDAHPFKSDVCREAIRGQLSGKAGKGVEVEADDARALGEQARRFGKTSYNAANVGFTRGSQSVTLLTNDLDRYASEIRREKTKETTLVSPGLKVHEVGEKRLGQVKDWSENKDQVAVEYNRRGETPKVKVLDAGKVRDSSGKSVYLSQHEKQTLAGRGGRIGILGDSSSGFYYNTKTGSIEYGHTYNLDGAKVDRTVTRDSTIESYTRRQGAMHTAERTVSRKDGSRVKMTESGFNQSGLFGCKRMVETITAGREAGAKKISDTYHFGNHYWGKVTEIQNGIATSRTWEGRMKGGVFTPRRLEVTKRGEVTTRQHRTMGDIAKGAFLASSKALSPLLEKFLASLIGIEKRGGNTLKVLDGMDKRESIQALRDPDRMPKKALVNAPTDKGMAAAVAKFREQEGARKEEDRREHKPRAHKTGHVELENF